VPWCGFPTDTANVAGLPESIGDEGFCVGHDDIRGFGQAPVTLLNDEQMHGETGRNGFCQDRERFQATSMSAECSRIIFGDFPAIPAKIEVLPK